MSRYIRDPVGTGVALIIGVALGVTLAAPMLPQQLGIEASVNGGHVTTLLAFGSLAIIAVPFGALLLYMFLARTGQ